MLWRRAWKPLLNLVTITHLVVLAIVVWPRISPRNPVVRLTRPYRLMTGLDQTWSMFATPRTFTFYIVATIQFADGTRSDITLPWDPSTGFWKRYRIVRQYAKFVNPLGLYNSKPQPMLYRDYARYLARTNARKRPVMVWLTSYWADILPLPKGVGKPLPERMKHHTYFAYQVAPEDLH